MQDGTKPLAELRRQAGMSQRELAVRAGVHHLTVNALENNRRRVPHPSTMRKIADAIGIDLTAVEEFIRVRRAPSKRRGRSRRQALAAAV